MKKTIFALGLIIISFSVNAQIISYNGSGQSKRNTQNNAGQNSNRQNYAERNTYDTEAELDAAWYNGTLVPYLPTDLKNYNVNPVDGVSSVRIPLGYHAKVKMPTRNGIQWVMIEQGSNCRFAVSRNGRPCETPYALDACGNEVLEFAYLPELNQQQFVTQGPCNDCPDQMQIQTQVQTQVQRSPCRNCPPTQNYSGYMNNYSNRVATRGASYPPIQDPIVYNTQRKGMPGIVKGLIATVVLTGITYAIFHKNASEPVDQQVITLPATSAKTFVQPNFGVGFSVHF